MKHPPDGGAEDGESSPGFAGTCKNTSLADWIQLVQMGRRDAVLSVRTHDGREGRLLCRGGDIIDASCDGYAGEDAVFEILAWEGGVVSVEFEACDGARHIERATAALLLQAAYRKDSGVQQLADVEGRRRAARAGAAPAPAPAPGDAAASARTDAPARAPPAASPALRVPSARDEERRRVVGVVLAFGAGLLGLVLLAGPVSGWVTAKEPESAVRALVVPEFLVQVDVQPAHAELSLDGKVVGVGRFERAIPRDGRVHEIRCTAPGHVSERLAFRDAPPPRRVTLTPIVQELAMSAGPLPSAALPAVARWPAARRSPGRATRPASPLTSPVTVPAKESSEAPRAARPDESRGVPPERSNVQGIEPRAPRIQIIDERKPRIEGIE